MTPHDPPTPRLTVWYISKYLAIPQGPEVGGRGYELMREAVAAGHECVVITSDSNHLAKVPALDQARLIERRDGLIVCWLRTLKFESARSRKRLLSWLHFESSLIRPWTRELPQPTHIIASSLSPLTFLSGAILARRYRSTFVVEVRDIWPLTLTEVGGVSHRHPLVTVLGWIERFAYRRADLIVGTMPNLKQHVDAVAPDHAPVKCIPMGFSERAVATQEVPTPRARTTADPIVVVYAGTVGLDNALDPLFEAIARLEHDHRFQFLILGDGDLRPAYERRYGDLSNVKFLGRVPKHKVHDVLLKADVLYLSTYGNAIWKYGQSLNKLIDYMLAARPIIASFDGYPSMIDESGCGTFIAPDSADSLIQELGRFAETDPAARTELGARARSWVLENRSYRRLALDYLDLLRATQPRSSRQKKLRINS